MKACILLLLISLPGYLSAQDIYEGKVFDASNNQPLAGATIRSESGSKGTITDAEGYFQWTVDDPVEVVEVNFVGYNPRRITFDGDRFYHIGMTISNNQLQEVIISAYRNGERYQDIPGSVSLITIKDLERGDGISITSPLNRIPGIYMHSGALNTNRITIRGIGSRSPFSTTKIRAYLNEIPLTTGTGETTIEDIDLGIVDRVEVIKGPSSSIYGAGLGGTINYSIKRSPYLETSVELGTKIGSYGLLATSASLQHASDFGNIKVSLNDLHSDGYRENNKYNRRSFSLSGQLFTGKRGILTMIGNWIDLRANIPSSIDRNTYTANPRAAAFTWKQVGGFEDYRKNLLGLNYMYNLSGKWFVSGSTFLSSRNSFELRPFNTLEEDSKSYGIRAFTGFENEKNMLLSKFNIGFEYFNEDYNWQTFENDTSLLLSDNQEKRKYYNIFSQMDISISSLTKLVLGVNINNTSYEFDDLYNIDTLNKSGNYSFDTQFSPRIALSHKLDQNHTIYASVSHGFSPPTLEETLTPDGRINPKIQPESGLSFESGSRGTIANSRLFYDISVYTMKIQNLLVARRVENDIFIGVNAGKTTHFGADFTMNYDLLGEIHSFWSTANIFLTYMYANYVFKEFVDGDDIYSDNQLTGTPPNKFNSGIDFSIHAGVFGSIEYNFVDAMPMNDANTDFSESYSLLNFKMGLKETFGNSHQFEMELSGGINNILDEKYASMISVNAPSFGGNPPRYYYPGLPRNYYGGVKLLYRFR